MLKVTIKIADHVVEEEGLKQVLDDVVYHQSHGLKQAKSECYEYKVEGLEVVTAYLKLKVDRNVSRKIHAIKIVRDHFDLSLREAKDLVDRAKYSEAKLPVISQVKLNRLNIALRDADTGYSIDIR